MSYQRSQTPTTAPQQAPFASPQAPTFSPLLGLQGLIGNSGVLDLLRPQMPGRQTDAGPSPLSGALQSVLQQDSTAPTKPPGGTEAPSTAVAATLADQGQTAAFTSAPSSPTTSAAAQVTALDETQDGVEGAITDSPTLTTAVAAELGTTPSEVQAQAQAAWQPSWWDEAVDWTVGGVGSLVDGGVDLLSDVPVLGTAAATMAPVTKFAWETLGGFAKGAGDFVGGLGHMVAHPLDTLSGLATMAEHIPGSPLKVMHKLYDVATTDKTLEETFWRNPLDVAKEDLSADWDFWKGVGGALLDPYERSVEQGKYGEALGRGIFDIGGLFVGASEAKAVSKGAEVVNVLEHASVSNKVDDSVKIASRANEFGAVTDDVVRAGGKADDVTKTASHVDELAEEAALPLGSRDEVAARPVSPDDTTVTQKAPHAKTTTPASDSTGTVDDAHEAFTHVDDAGLKRTSSTQDGPSTEPSSTIPEATPVNERPPGKANPYQADDAAQVEADLRRQFEVKNEVARKKGEPEPYPDLDTAVREAGERYQEVVARGYPFGFESLEHFATFKSSLRTLLDEFGIPHDELAVHGSAVHKANPNDLDIAVMAGEDKWASTAEALRARTKHPKVRKSLEREIGKGKVGSFLFPRLDEGGSLMERLMQLEGLPSTQVSLVLRGGKYDIGPYLDF